MIHTQKSAAQGSRPSSHRSKSSDVSSSKISGRVGKAPNVSASGPVPEPESVEALMAADSDVTVPPTLPFKKSQLVDRYPRGQTRGRSKNLKQILAVENTNLLPPNEPTYTSIESPPALYPAKKYCDITGFEGIIVEEEDRHTYRYAPYINNLVEEGTEAPYTDPRTKLRYADTETFVRIRNLPDEYIQGLLSLRSAQIVLK